MKKPQIDPTHRAILDQKRRVEWYVQVERHAASAAMFSTAASIGSWAAVLTSGIHGYEIPMVLPAGAGAALTVAVVVLGLLNGRRHRATMVYRALQAKAAIGE